MMTTAYKHVILTDEGTPVIAGTNFKLKQLIVERQAHGSSPEELAYQHPQLSLAQVYSALAYYEDHKDLIDGLIHEGDIRSEALRSKLDAIDLKETINLL